MAFVAPLPAALPRGRRAQCAQRRTPRAGLNINDASKPRNDSSLPPPPPNRVSSEEATPRRAKLTRNKPGEEVEMPVSDGAEVAEDGSLFAEAYPGEVGGVEVGTGMGGNPKYIKEDGEKKASPAAAAQGYMTFADAWNSQARDSGRKRFDVWAVIGLLFILTPPVIIVVAILTGAIPGFANIGN